jgi:hypothetical protein
MGRIAGRYTTRRDNGITYTYEASWQEADGGITWSTTVKRERELAGAPNGQIRSVAGLVVADEVRRLVERAIETRAGVE